MQLRLRNSNIGNPATQQSTFSWSSYWATLISATVENAAPTNVVLTFPSGKPSLLATDLTCTVNGVARTINSASWVGGIWTVVLASAVVYGDVVVMTFVKTGQSKAVTNNVLESLARNTDTVEIGGYPALSSTYNLSFALGGRSFCNMNNVTKVRQTGTITKVQFYLDYNVEPTALYFDLWRKDGATWDRYAHVDLMTLKIDGLCDITLPAPISCQEGDFIGISGAPGGGGQICAPSGFGNSRYVAGYPTDTDYNWGAGTLLTNFAESIKTLGQAPLIVGIGDSIMAGHNSHYSMVEVNETVSLTDHPLAYLKVLDTKYVFQNMGIGGQTTTLILARFTTDCVNLKPKLALINGGVNDIAGGVISKATFLSNWTNMLDACETAGIIPVVCKILPWTNGTNGQMQTRDDWMIDLQTLVATYTGSVWVDFDTDMGMFRVGGDAGNLWDLKTVPDYNDDGVHTTSIGKSKMADVINTAIKTEYNLT